MNWNLMVSLKESIGKSRNGQAGSICGQSEPSARPWSGYSPAPDAQACLIFSGQTDLWKWKVLIKKVHKQVAKRSAKVH